MDASTLRALLVTCDGQGKEAKAAALDALLESVPQWIAVTPETLPESRTPVIAFYLNCMGKERVVRAEWAAPKTLRLSDDAVDYDAEYDDDGEAWCPEGWYESNENEDVHWKIDEPVLFWQPLPAPPVLP